MFNIINVCCVYSLESPHRGDSNECTQHTLARQKKKISLNYPYIVFGGNPCGLKTEFNSSMVNVPSGFEPLKFYCVVSRLHRCAGISVYTVLGTHVLVCFAVSRIIWPEHAKTCVRALRTAKVQIRLRIRAVWSGPTLSTNRAIGYYRMYERRAKAQTILCACLANG